MQVSDLLTELAAQLGAQLVSIGGNPSDVREVEEFIHGCNIPQKLANLLVNELDDE